MIKSFLLFENNSQIIQDVRDIFNEFIYDDMDDVPKDTDYAGQLNEYDYGILVTIYGIKMDDPNISNINEFDNVINEVNKYNTFLKKMKMLCYRLKSWGYDFDFINIIDDNTSYIKVYNNNKKLDLTDAFYDRRLDNNVLKRVFKSKYNIDIVKIVYNPSIKSVWSSTIAYYDITFKQKINTNHVLFKDLTNLSNDYNIITVDPTNVKYDGQKDTDKHGNLIGYCNSIKLVYT